MSESKEGRTGIARKTGAAAASAGVQDVTCFKYSTEKWPGYEGPCNFSDISDSSIDIEGGTRVFTEGGPIVLGTIIEFTGRPQRIQLEYDLEWVGEGSRVLDTVRTGHDSVRDAGSGRFYQWWGWSFALNEPPTGEEIELQGVVRDAVSGDDALLSTPFAGDPSTVPAQVGAEIEEVEIASENFFV